MIFSRRTLLSGLNFYRARLLFATLTLMFFAGCGGKPGGSPKVPVGAKSSGGLNATLEAAQGVIEIAFLPNDAPKAVEYFQLLAEHGYYVKGYDGTVGLLPADGKSSV